MTRKEKTAKYVDMINKAIADAMNAAYILQREGIDVNKIVLWMSTELFEDLLFGTNLVVREGGNKDKLGNYCYKGYEINTYYAGRYNRSFSVRIETAKEVLES